MKGVIIENSLSDVSILQKLDISRSWEEGSWKLHEVEVSREQALEFQNVLDDGQWYVHFWEKGSDDVLVVFKDKFFDIKFSDKFTWTPALEHGVSLGIPPEQLDFPID